MSICLHCFAADSQCTHCDGSGTIPDELGDRGVSQNVELFGSEKYPLHASALPSMIECPWRVTMLFLQLLQDESNAAADTGSATHVAVAQWHRDKNVAAAINAMSERRGKYPQADLAEASQLFLRYAADPRNQEAKFAVHPNGTPFIEEKIQFKITPATEDPTSSPIHVIGTLDQIRIGFDGKPKVWDLKTSKRPGGELLNAHLYQIAAYALGASGVLKVPVGLGGLICPRHYKNNAHLCPPGVFWEYSHRFHDIEYLLNGIRHLVAQVRRGQVWAAPGHYCRYCPAEGSSNCVPSLKQASHPETKRIHLKVVS